MKETAKRREESMQRYEENIEKIAKEQKKSMREIMGAFQTYEEVRRKEFARWQEVERLSPRRRGSMKRKSGRKKLPSYIKVTVKIFENYKKSSDTT